MSLNYRAFQPGLSPSVMAYSQPALWSRLLFLIAGFKNNCPAPFRKRQLDNDLVQKCIYLFQSWVMIKICLPVRSPLWVWLFLRVGGTGAPRGAALGVPMPCPGTGEPCSGMPELGVQGLFEQQGWGVGAATDTPERRCLVECFWKGAFLEMHSWKPCKRMMKRLGKAALSCVNAAGVFLGCCLTALFYLKEMPAVWIWCEVHWRWREG